MAETKKMICAYCGTEMNHHAEKLMEPRTSEEARNADPELGTLIKEFHSCPNCGKSAERSGH
jgi:hypothetical protein